MRSLVCAAAAAFLLIGCTAEKPPNYDEYDIDTFQAMMEGGDLTTRDLVEYYLGKIDSRGRNSAAVSSIYALGKY